MVSQKPCPTICSRRMKMPYDNLEARSIDTPLWKVIPTMIVIPIALLIIAVWQHIPRNKEKC